MWHPRTRADMPRTQAPKWHAPGVSAHTCVEGGYLKGPRAICCETFTLTDVAPAEGKQPEELFTPVSKSEAWLVEAVSGKHYSQRVLKRSTVFQDLRDAVLRGGAVDKKMSALRYEEDSDEDAQATPVREKKRIGCAQDKVGVASPEKIRMNTTATSEARSETSEAA